MSRRTRKNQGCKASCRDLEILDEHEIYTEADYLFVIRAQKRVYATYGGRGTLGIRNSRSPSARVNGPPLLPSVLLIPFSLSQFRLAPPRDGGHAIEQFFRASCETGIQRRARRRGEGEGKQMGR